MQESQPAKSKRKRIRRRIVLAIIAILLVIAGPPVVFLLYKYSKDAKHQTNQKQGYANDASHLNETRVSTIIQLAETKEAAIIQITDLVRRAKNEGKKISIAGAQHSMGGHTIYPDGILLDMKNFHYMQLDTTTNILLVGSGALWSEIIPYLDKKGKSVAVMQSNNSFSVGGSISVNCHGWQANTAPIASTVESFRLITANAEIVNCSRTENSELFSLALGGYGLFGVILDVKLRIVDNAMYKIQQYIIKSSDYIDEFKRLVKPDTAVRMAYGRININPNKFMKEAILSTFKITDATSIEPLKETSAAGLRRTVFRGSANSDYGKNLRWRAEKLSMYIIKGEEFSRNQLLNEGVEVFQNTDTNYTDILHEYFIPTDSVGSFIDSLRTIIPGYQVDLLNITLRNVERDDDCFLRYADKEVFGFVMLFNQRRSSGAENEMRLLTQRLIDVAHSLGGTFYLPYRLHATKVQFYSIYPNAEAFFLLKRKYDSTGIFQNKFYETYK